MDCSTPGLPVPHSLPEFAQVHVHWIGDAIQPSHPLLLSSPAFNLSQHQGLFQWIGSLHQVALWSFSSVQSLSRVWLFATPWTAACQASLSITNSRSPPKPMCNCVGDAIQPSHPLLSPSTPALSLSQHQVFSNESALHIRWPKYWSFSFNISLPINTQDWSPLGWTGWISLQSKGLSRVSSNTTVEKHQFFSA